VLNSESICIHWLFGQIWSIFRRAHWYWNGHWISSKGWKNIYLL